MDMTDLVALVAVVLCACHGHQAIAPTANVTTPVHEDPTIISLARSACLGFCPAYEVSIAASGRVTYVGDSSVKREGTAKGSISAAALQALVAELEAAKLETYPDTVDGHTLDVPTLDLQFRRKTIHFRPGVYFRGSPEEVQFATLDRLGKAIDRAVDIEQWIGTEAERRALEAAETRARAIKACSKKAPEKQAACYEDFDVEPPLQSAP